MGSILAIIATCIAAVVSGLISFFSSESDTHRPTQQTNAAPIPNSSKSIHRSYYATKDGKTTTAFYFSFEQQHDGAWRAFIEKQPSYGNRGSDGHATHRLTDGDRKYVCWDSPLKTLEACQQVAALWADATQEYINNGKSF